MTNQSQQDAMDRLRRDVQEERDALAAARTALAGVAQAVRDNIDDTDALNELADSLEADDLPAAIVEGTPADPNSTDSTSSTSGASGSDGGTVDPHTVEGAAAAGGYNVGPGQAAQPASDDTAGSVVADTGAASAAAPDGVDSADGDRLTTQDAREGAGPFTGTGAQDALRTSGRLGDTDAHTADTRTVEDGADERTQDDSGEGQPADGADAPDAGGSGSDVETDDAA